MNQYVVEFHEIDQKWRMAVGGKGVNLGELTKISDIPVPEGFCVTTKAFRKSIESNEDYQTLLEELTPLKAENRVKIGEVSREIREIILKEKIPDDTVKAVSNCLAKY